MFNAICPLKTVPYHFFETKIKCCCIIFCITGAYNKLLVQKVHLNVAEPFVKNAHVVKFCVIFIRILHIDKIPPTLLYFAFDSNFSHAWHNFIIFGALAPM